MLRSSLWSFDGRQLWNLRCWAEVWCWSSLTMFCGFQRGAESLWVLLVVIGKDRSCLLNLIVVRRPHLSLISGTIPLETSIYSDLFVVSLCNITSLGLFSRKIYHLWTLIVMTILALVVNWSCIARVLVCSRRSLIRPFACSHLRADPNLFMLVVHNRMNCLLDLSLLCFV